MAGGVRLRGSGSARNIRFGASCSPLAEGRVVLPNVGGKGASVVTFEKDSDEATWKALADCRKRIRRRGHNPSR